jgi:hypothetical protein
MLETSHPFATADLQIAEPGLVSCSRQLSEEVTHRESHFPLRRAALAPTYFLCRYDEDANLYVIGTMTPAQQQKSGDRSLPAVMSAHVTRFGS